MDRHNAKRALLRSFFSPGCGFLYLTTDQLYMNIYLFGNPLLNFDSLPLLFKAELEKEFPNISFSEADPSENLKPENKELFIIDSAAGIKEVTVLEDLTRIKTEAAYSLHDFDLGATLKLLKKIGVLEKASIFCVPQEGDEKKILSDLKEKIKQRLI